MNSWKALGSDYELKKEEAWLKSFVLGSEYGFKLFAMLKKYHIVWFADLFWPDKDRLMVCPLSWHWKQVRENSLPLLYLCGCENWPLCGHAEEAWLKSCFGEWVLTYCEFEIVCQASRGWHDGNKQMQLCVQFGPWVSMRVPSGGKSSKCDLCKFSTSQNSESEHSYESTGGKSNKCHQCKFATSQTAKLRIHKGTQWRKFNQCDRCDYM